MEKKNKIISLKEEDEKNQKESEDNNNSYFCPTPKTNEKTIAKPDFSLLLIKETQFGFKTNGSYKRQRYKEPCSPIKSINKKHSISAKIEGRDLFNSKIAKIHCRKLIFDEENDQEKIQKNNNDFCFNMFESSFLNNQQIIEKQNKMENEFILIKTIKELNLDCVYKVKERKTNKIFCIKKISKNSQKYNVKNTQKLFNDMKNKNIIPGLKEEPLLGSFFCNHYLDFWVEEENYDLNKNIYMPEKYFYILYPFYSNGDLLDYLEKLEKKPNNTFTPDFYWDIIFEMIMGVKYFHELGYLHLDIKPTNFLVDENGYIKLTDFGLCHKISEIPFLTDIIEGDFTYISKELFNFNSHRILNTKTDIFSLGLSILEIVGKIILPSSGESWIELRSGNFEIKEKLFNNSYIKDKKEDFIKLITKMIAPINERPDLNQLINDFQELKNRYISLKNHVYKKAGVI